MSAALLSILARRRLLPLLLALFGLFVAHAQAAADPPIDVAVRMQGGEVFVDVDFHIAATPQQAWEVMTDYDHATAFISHLEKSAIVSRTEDTLLVSQKGTMGWGPFSVPLETVTEVRLMPFERILGHLVSGNMKKGESTTQFTADPTGTRVVYHLETIPDVWLPPLIGRAIVTHETRARFRQLVEEILRRRDLAGAKRLGQHSKAN